MIKMRTEKDKDFTYVVYSVPEINSAKTALKWIKDILLNSKLTVAVFRARVLGNFDDGGFRYSRNNLHELENVVNCIEKPDELVISCKCFFNEESIIIIIIISDSEVQFMIPANSSIDTTNVAYEIGIS